MLEQPAMPRNANETASGKSRAVQVAKVSSMNNAVHGNDIVQLRAFVAVAEQLSFSRAAGELGVSPSALSQSIRGLEERIGVRLLNRTTRSVSLTPNGEILLGLLRPALDAVSAAVTHVKSLAGRPVGVVRLHAARLAARDHLAPRLAAFHAAFPEIVLDMTVDDQIVDVVADGFDAAIRHREVIEKDMIAVCIGPEHRQVAFASPAYLAKHGKPDTPDDLTSHSCIRWRWAGSRKPYAWEFARNGKWFEVVVDGPLVVDDRPIMIQAAVDGMGIAFATETEIEPHVVAGRVVPLLQDWSESFPGFFLSYPQQRQMAPALRALIDFLQAN